LDDNSKLTLPFAWLQIDLDDRLIDHIRAICTPTSHIKSGKIAAMVFRGSSLVQAPSSKSMQYLVKSTDGYDELSYGALCAQTRKEIAFHILELEDCQWPVDEIARQSLFIRQGTQGWERFAIFVFQSVFIVLNEKRLDEFLQEFESGSFDQEALDRICITLGAPPKDKSAHAVLQAQSPIDQVHEILLNHAVPVEIDIAKPRLPPLT